MPKSRTIAFLGKSGSGKDTQAGFVADKLDPVLIVSTGDIFREVAGMDTSMGRLTKELMESGGLWPHWFASFAWQDVLLKQLKGDENIVFPSSPRNESEARELDEVLEWLGRGLPEAVLVDISDEEALKRLLGRGRSDDNEEDIKARLAWFKPHVGPTIEYYEKGGRLHRIDGMGSVEEVRERVARVLGI